MEQSTVTHGIPLTVPCISSCCIIQLSHVLIVIVVIPRSTDLHIQIPITIGNVPFKGRQAVTTTYSPAQNFYAQGGTYPPQPGNPYPPPPYPPVGPPPGRAINYSTAHPPVNITNDTYTMGEIQYAPVYGFVTNYQHVLSQPYSKAVSKV